MNKSKYNKKFIVGIAVALLVPLSFYVVTRLLSKDKIVLPPYYLVDHIEKREENGVIQYDTVYHQVKDMQLVNQFGETRQLNSQLPGKILVVTFFHSGDTATANALTRNMVLLQRAFRKTGMKQNDTLVQFISVSSQPEADSAPVLRAYAEGYPINQDRWWFMTGNKDVIDSLRHHELGLDGIAGPPQHGTIVLLDKERFIRGYYNGLDVLNLRACANDIGWLALEKKRKKRIVNDE